MVTLAAACLMFAVARAIRAQDADGPASAPALARGPASGAAPVTRPAGAPPEARILPEGWLLPPKREYTPPPLPQTITNASIIPIHGPITESTYDAVKRKAMRCKAKGAQIVIFDMDTPGGSGQAMDDIVRVILTELGDTYTVAFVNPEAYSAGAVISLACNEIVYSPTGKFGDAMPIYISGGQILPLPPEVRAKFESAMRADIRVLAKRNGYDVLMCEAMITLKTELWLIRSDAGELRIVDADAWRTKVRNPPATTQPYHATGGQAERPAWEFLEVVDGPDKLVTLTADEALRWGFTKHVIRSMQELERHYGIAAPPTVLEDTWSEDLVDFLTSPAVSGILLFIAVLGIYVELNTPGVGLPGAVAVIALALLFGSRYLTGLAQWWEIAVFVLGLVLLVVEIFVTPGFGVIGMIGLVLCAVGLLAMIVPNAPDKLPLPATSLDWRVFKTGLLALCLGLLGGLVAAAVVARHLPKMPVAGRLVLTPPAPAPRGVEEPSPLRGIRVGQVGTVASPCRPAGQVRFGEQLVDAVAEGEYIPRGTQVKVIRNEGNRIVVTSEEA